MEAQIEEREIPVFPEVGSITVEPCLRTPFFSAFSIIDKPILSFTDESGLKNSSFASIFPYSLYFFLILLSLTKGVFPIVSIIELKIFSFPQFFLDDKIYIPS